MRRAALKLGLVGPVAAALVLFATPAFAAAAADSPTWLGIPRWIFSWINLFVLFGGLGYVAWPHIRKFLDERQNQIASSLELSGRQRKEAKDLLAGLEGQLDALRAEVDEFEARMVADAEREESEILAAATAECERITRQAGDEIDSHVAQARRELTVHAARLASDLAREQLSGALDEAGRADFFKRGLERLEREVVS